MKKQIFFSVSIMVVAITLNTASCGRLSQIAGAEPADRPDQNGMIPESTIEATPTPQPSQLDGIFWEQEPMYEDVMFWDGLFRMGDLGFDTVKREFTKEAYYDYPWGGGDFIEYIYDEGKDLLGYFSVLYEPYLVLYTRDEFIGKYPMSMNNLIAFRKIDSDKIIEYVYEENEQFTLPGYDLSEAYIGKTGFAYGTIFVTDFIYDYNPHFLSKNDRPHAAAARLDGKWGIIGKDGTPLVPFIFEDITLIDDNTAFAKYDGKYGILDYIKATDMK